MSRRIIQMSVLLFILVLGYLGISNKVFDFRGTTTPELTALRGQDTNRDPGASQEILQPPARIYGPTRYQTSKAIAEYADHGSVQNAILVSGNGFSDALSAGDLAHQLHAPVLLVDVTASASQDAFDYLSQHLLKDGTVYLVGGTGIIGTDFEEALQRLGYSHIERIGGTDRYDTGIRVNERLSVPKGTPVVLASGENYPDALSISSIAAYNGWPVVLVPGTSLPAPVRDFLNHDQPAKVYIAGGEGVVSLSTQAEIHTLLPDAEVQRLAGPTRFDTAARIMQTLIPQPKTLYLASGYDFADALSGSALASRTGDPIVLVDPELISLPLGIDEYVAKLGEAKVAPAVIALGGPHVVTDMVMNTAKNTLSGTISPQLAWLRSLKDTDFVDVQSYVPFVQLDIRYATANNFMKAKVYDSSKAYLRKGTADKLKTVAEDLSNRGYRLKIWDAYRPPSVQFKMWKLVPDSNYVADPYKGFSNHSRGIAVDLTLADAAGNELPMPSGFDDFSPKADRNYSDVGPLEAKDAQFLEEVMKQHGFKPLATEWWHFDDVDADHYGVAENTSVSQPPAPQRIQRDKLTISAIGDNTLGTDSAFGYSGSFPEAYAQHGPEYFFSNVKNILESDDLTIANLETTLTTANKKADKSFQDEAYWFRGAPAYTQILKDGGIEAVNIANNHSLDFLAEGLSDTEMTLTKEGIGYFGYDQDYVTEKKGIKIGLLGYNPLGSLEQGTDIKALQREMAAAISKLRSECQIIIVSFHWGQESSYQPDAQQLSLGHYAIDQGADLVLGHHPHVIQPVEQYKGKYIVYSLGNFCFGGNKNPLDYDSFIFQQSFDIVGGEVWGEQRANVIPCSVSSTSGQNDFRPTVVSGPSARRVLDKVKLPQ